MSMLKAKLHAALEKLGHVNGTAPLDSQDPLDEVAHEFTVANTIRGYAEKRYESAKTALATATSITRIDEAKAKVKKNQTSENLTLASGQFHTVTAQVKIGASFLDVNSLRVELLKKMTTDEVDKLFDRHMKRRAPSVTYMVSEDDDG